MRNFGMVALAATLCLAGCANRAEQTLAAADEIAYQCREYNPQTEAAKYNECIGAQQMSNRAVVQSDEDAQRRSQQALRDINRAINSPTTTCTTGRDAYGNLVTRCGQEWPHLLEKIGPAAMQ